MRKSIELQVERSERREVVNGLLAKETPTDEERASMDAATKRLQEIEGEIRVALTVEAAEDDAADEARAAETRGAELSAEDRERLALRAKAGVGKFLKAAPSGRMATGRRVGNARPRY